ncbi:MAG: YigZ family protein [Clostridia bacterium]|nr:YigZ family protein [Clostridia bacterium]
MIGEPSGTAGAPILKIILEKNLSNVLVVVTRYFGGVLLGTGGLVRAYSDVTIKALEKTEYINKIMGYEIKIYVEYDKYEQLKYYVSKSNIKILNTQYLENIEIIVEMSEEKLTEFTNINNKNSFEIIKYDILKEKYIEI